MWKGAIIKESLIDQEILDNLNIIKIKEIDYNGLNGLNLCYVELNENKKDDLIPIITQNMKKKFYAYFCKNKVMYVIFNKSMFKFSKGFPEMQFAKKEGVEQGIPKSLMPFEHLIENPFDWL